MEILFEETLLFFSEERGEGKQFRILREFKKVSGFSFDLCFGISLFLPLPSFHSCMTFAAPLFEGKQSAERRHLGPTLCAAYFIQ
eukprot:gene10156-7111_t